MIMELQRGSCGVSPAALRPVLPALAKVISKKSNISILQTVKVEPLHDEGMLRLSATDLDFYVTVEVPATLRGGEKTVLVKLADLQQEAKAAGSGERINLWAMACGGSEVDEYPIAPELERATTRFHFDQRAIEQLLQAFQCTSDDETRYVLRGVFLDPGEGGRIVGTEGHHLVCFDAPGMTALKEGVILPNHKVWSWRGCREASGWTLRVGRLGKEGPFGFRVEDSQFTIVGKCIEGNYPTYRQVIPSEGQFVTRVELDRKKMEETADTLEKLPGKSTTVGLRVTDGGLGLLHREDGCDDYVETVFPFSRRTGPDITVLLNREYLIKPLRFGFTRMELIDACSPVKFSGKDGFVIVMPMRCETPVQVRATEKQNEGVSETPPSEESESQPQKEDQQPKENMRTTTNHNGNGNHNGHAEADGNGNRLPSTTSYNPEEAITPSDPVDAAIQQLAKTKEALKEALTGLSGLTATLKEVRQQQRDTEREIKTVRSTIRSLRELKL